MSRVVCKQNDLQHGSGSFPQLGTHGSGRTVETVHVTDQAPGSIANGSRAGSVQKSIGAGDGSAWSCHSHRGQAMRPRWQNMAWMARLKQARGAVKCRVGVILRQPGACLAPLKLGVARGTAHGQAIELSMLTCHHHKGCQQILPAGWLTVAPRQGENP